MITLVLNVQKQQILDRIRPGWGGGDFLKFLEVRVTLLIGMNSKAQDAATPFIIDEVSHIETSVAPEEEEDDEESRYTVAHLSAVMRPVALTMILARYVWDGIFLDH